MKKFALLFPCLLMASCSSAPATSDVLSSSSGWKEIAINYNNFTRYIRTEAYATEYCWWQFHGALTFAIYDVTVTYSIAGNDSKVLVLDASGFGETEQVYGRKLTISISRVYGTLQYKE